MTGNVTQNEMALLLGAFDGYRLRAGGAYSEPMGDQRAGKPDERTVPLSVCVAACVVFSSLAAVVVAVVCSMPMP